MILRKKIPLESYIKIETNSYGVNDANPTQNVVLLKTKQIYNCFKIDIVSRHPPGQVRLG